MSLPRSVNFDPQFEREVAEIQPDVRRVDEARRYLDWVLGLHPERGVPSDYPGVLIAPLKLPRADNTLVATSVFYIYDDQYAHVLSIRLRPPEAHAENA